AAGRRRRALRTADAVQLAEVGRPARTQVIPGAHVEWLFLDPEQFGAGVGLDGLGQVLVGERVELLDADDGDVVALLRFAAGEQVVIDLAAAQEDAPRLFDRVVPDETAERALREIVECRNRVLVAQQGLRRHHDQRLSPLAPYWPAQQRKDLRRGGRIADLHVVSSHALPAALEP